MDARLKGIKVVKYYGNIPNIITAYYAIGDNKYIAVLLKANSSSVTVAAPLIIGYWNSVLDLMDPGVEIQDKFCLPESIRYNEETFELYNKFWSYGKKE